MRKKVYITRKLPEEIIEKLSSHFSIKMWDKEEVPVPREVLLEEISEADGLFCMLTDNIDEELLNRAPRLKVVSTLAVGYNNIDVVSAKKRRIIVTNTPGILTETTADLTFGLLMASARRMIEASDFLKSGQWGAWSPMQLTGQDVYGATLGIIGLGRIGESIVKRAKGFDMNVLYYNRSRKVEKEKELGIEYTEFNDLLQRADFVCVMIPYSSEVHHLIGREELALMKPNSILINTARGGIVDEDALYEALKSRKIWGAGLDVFESEPVQTEHPLLTLSNVTTFPHIGSASVKTRISMAHLAADNVINVLNGHEPITEVK